MSIISKLIAATAALVALATTAAAQPLIDPVTTDDDPIATPPPATSAAEDRPYLAFGAARSLAGVGGPSAIVRLTDVLDLDAVVGVARLGGAMGMDDRTHVGVVVGVRYAVARRGAAALSLGGRVGAIAPADADGTTLVLEAPARLELTVAPWLRVHVEGGFALARTPDGEAGIEGPAAEGETTWSLGASGLVAGAGFALAL